MCKQYLTNLVGARVGYVSRAFCCDKEEHDVEFGLLVLFRCKEGEEETVFLCMNRVFDLNSGSSLIINLLYIIPKQVRKIQDVKKFQRCQLDAGLFKRVLHGSLNSNLVVIEIDFSRGFLRKLGAFRM